MHSFDQIITGIKVAIVPIFLFYVALLKGVSSGYRWLFGLSDIILAKRRVMLARPLVNSIVAGVSIDFSPREHIPRI